MARWWGWVAEIRGRVAGCAHHLEKSALGLTDTSIHRLPYRHRISSSKRGTILVVSESHNGGTLSGPRTTALPTGARVGPPSPTGGRFLRLYAIVRNSGNG